MTVTHVHHIVPKHAGGTDDPSNLIEVTVEEHAELHFARYLQYGELGDWVAAMGLSGQISSAEATALARRDWLDRHPDHLSNCGKKGGRAPASDLAKAIAAETARALGNKPWWTNGIKSTRSLTCPGEGWTRGRRTTTYHPLKSN